MAGTGEVRAMATSTTTFQGFRPGGDPVPRRPGREQLAGVVPAAQGRLRAPDQAADGGAVRRARGGVPGARHPAPRGPGSKSPFRIYRDTRFSKDKTPYKTAAAASFSWAGDGVDATAGRSHTESGPRERRLLPPPAGRDLRGRRRVAPGQGVARRVPAADRRRPRRLHADRRGAGVRGDVRRGLATTASRSSACRPATRPITRPRTCCARRT